MDARLERIGRYAAVARGLEREGAYNAAKLLRAALQRELVRYAEQEGPSGGTAAADALDALVTDLGPVPPRAWSSSSARPARPGRPHDLPRGGAAGRTCAASAARPSWATTSRRPARACEAPALSFHEELPVWYLGPADRGAILAALVGGPRHLARALEGRTDEELARPPAPGRVVGPPDAGAPAVQRRSCSRRASTASWTRRSRTSPPPRSGRTRPRQTRDRRPRASRPPSSPHGSRSCGTRRSGGWQACPRRLGARRYPPRVGPRHRPLAGGVLRAPRGVPPGPTRRRGGGAAARPAGLRSRPREREAGPPAGRTGFPVRLCEDQARSLALSSSYCCSLMVPASLRAASFASSSAVETWLTAVLAASARASVWTSLAVTLGRMSM